MVTILIPIGVLAVTKISKFEIIFKNNIKSMAQAGLYSEDGILYVGHFNKLSRKGLIGIGCNDVFSYQAENERTKKLPVDLRQ